MKVIIVDDLMRAADKSFHYGEYIRLKFLVNELDIYDVDLNNEPLKIPSLEEYVERYGTPKQIAGFKNRIENKENCLCD